MLGFQYSKKSTVFLSPLLFIIHVLPVYLEQKLSAWPLITFHPFHFKAGFHSRWSFGAKKFKELTLLEIVKYTFFKEPKILTLYCTVYICFLGDWLRL